MTEPRQGTPLSIERNLPVGGDELWRACSTAEGLQSWQADEVEGQVAQGQALELSWPSLGASARLVVDAVEPPHAVHLSSARTGVALNLDGRRLRLTHYGLEPGDEAEGTMSGWALALGTLHQHLACHRGRKREVWWAVTEASVEAATAHAFFTDARLLAAWLGSTHTGIGEVGTEVELRLAAEHCLRGRVLAHVGGRDAAITWPEQGDSALAFRTLPSPRAAERRLLCLQWSRWHAPEPPEEVRQLLSTALGRLARLLSARASA